MDDRIGVVIRGCGFWGSTLCACVPNCCSRGRLFPATRQPIGTYPDPTLGWGDLIEGELELYEIPAYHKTMLFEPQVKTMADLLVESMDRVRSQGG